MNYRVMPALTLSTGVKLLSEHVKAADYYPRGSRRNNVFLDGAFTRHDGALARHEQDFLYIRIVKNGAAHVRGGNAAQDATVLEQAGVQVYRHPIPASSRAS
jgi:hypothetical protein